MIECIVDTHILAGLLRQFNTSKPNALLRKSDYLSDNMVQIMNRCIETNGFSGIIVASTFAFIELINRLEQICEDAVTISKVIGVLKQPPDWFVVEPFSRSTTFHLIPVPKRNLSGEPIELADAIHVATALQRGPNSFLATYDGVLKNINYDNLKIQHIA